MILAGDVGGTKTQLAAFDRRRGEQLHCLAEETFASRSYASLRDIVDAFVDRHRPPIKAACFGVAGPVRHGRVQTTNLPWVVDGAELGERLDLPEDAVLINDLEANALGLAALGPGDLLVLNPGESGASGNAAIISAGTGLGEAGLFWDTSRYLPFASEGGHCDFAPSDALQTELLTYLRARFGHVSWERVLSGPGLFNIYEFLRDSGRGEEPSWLTMRLGGGDPSAMIARAGLDGSSQLCAQALDLFVALYGAEAGNLALKVMATGGLFIGGGIAPKILPRLIDGPFLPAFVAKGRLQPLLEAIPVRVVLNQRTALFGAALRALGSLHGQASKPVPSSAPDLTFKRPYIQEKSPMSKRVQEILSWYGSDNPGTLTNLARLLGHGRLAGTGKLVILPVDQGFEHGPARSFASNPPAYDPRYHFELAIESGCSAYAAPLGFLEAGARQFAGEIPLILKVNDHDVLLSEADPDQALTGSVADALRLGCIGIGFTIYPGSSHRLQMYNTIRAYAEEAKRHGLIVVIWSYPRGSALSKAGETAIDVTAYAAHIAAQLGAHVVKVKLPTAHIEQAEARRVYEKENIPVDQLAERVLHVVQSTFAGRRIVIFSGGATNTDEAVLDEIRAIQAGGGFGSIIGRNSFQRPKADALRLLSEIINIYVREAVPAAAGA